MANLSDEKRIEVWAELMRELSRNNETVSISKADLREAVDDIDAFFNSNAATINAAIPQPARGALSTSQKARLLMFVISKRFVEGA